MYFNYIYIPSIFRDISCWQRTPSLFSSQPTPGLTRAKLRSLRLYKCWVPFSVLYGLGSIVLFLNLMRQENPRFPIVHAKEQNFCLIICLLIFAFIYFIIFVTSDYNLAPQCLGSRVKSEYDAIASFLCSYVRCSTYFASVVSRPPCHSDTLTL